MCKARGAFGALLLRPCAMAIFGALAITLGLGSSLALGPYDDPRPRKAGPGPRSSGAKWPTSTSAAARPRSLRMQLGENNYSVARL
jgi:hypothetical protein